MKKRPRPGTKPGAFLRPRLSLTAFKPGFTTAARASCRRKLSGGRLRLAPAATRARALPPWDYARPYPLFIARRCRGAVYPINRRTDAATPRNGLSRPARLLNGSIRGALVSTRSTVNHLCGWLRRRCRWCWSQFHYMLRRNFSEK